MLMARVGTNESRTSKIAAALHDLRLELASVRKAPPDLREAAFALADWVGERPHGIKRISIASKARNLLIEPLSIAFLGYVDRDLIDRASNLDDAAIGALRDQTRDARCFLPEVHDASAHLDSACDTLLALSIFFKRVLQVRRSGSGLVSERQGGAEVARTKTSLSGQEYCNYCHRPSQIYQHVHGREMGPGLVCVSGPPTRSAAGALRSLPVGLSSGFCDAHVGGSSNRWSKACSRNRDRARSRFRAYKEVLEGARLFRPHSERTHRYITEVLASPKLHQVEIPRLRAGHRHTAPIANALLTRIFAPLGLPQTWLQVDDDLCEIAASPDGYFLRTSVAGEDCFEVSSELELLGWRAAFGRCLDSFRTYLHPESHEAWLTLTDPRPDPESPFRDFPVADLSMVYPHADHLSGGVLLPRIGPAHRHVPREERPSAVLQALVPVGDLEHPPEPVLRLSFISPVWLSRVSLVKPEVSRTEP